MRFLIHVSTWLLHDQKLRYQVLAAVAGQVTHPKLLQVHRQTVVSETSGEPAEEDRQLMMDRCRTQKALFPSNSTFTSAPLGPVESDRNTTWWAGKDRAATTQPAT